jgi:hypothetical protein
MQFFALQFFDLGVMPCVSGIGNAPAPRPGPGKSAGLEHYRRAGEMLIEQLGTAKGQQPLPVIPGMQPAVFDGWEAIEGPRTRANAICELTKGSRAGSRIPRFNSR